MRQNPHVRICGGPGSATTLVYPTVEQRCDEFAAHLVGLYDRPALSVGALPPALDPTSANVRLPRPPLDRHPGACPCRTHPTS